jgi:hypothetical protein
MQLLVSGLLYLSGIALILWLRPALMFRENGTWKEFGIGRGENYTWLPIWMFAITWALMSYVIVFSIRSLFRPQVSATQPIPQTKYKSRNQPAAAPELVPGYYRLNTSRPTDDTGVPRYVYVGQSLDDL